MKQFISRMLATVRAEGQKGSAIIDGLIEMCIGVIGLVIILAFVNPSVMTGTDTATNLAQVALPLIMIVLIMVGAFTSIKSATKGI